ncbi:DUF4145 domain-containing protein [Lactobacillus psittaci]|uniref:DUF4145 domain-containing protein n=1 Tax=Lactobacillus psittaci DSM 15354 TaxID=1122152 RepID=A0A0R1SAY7_9LACO|nr:hypothetical protein [Lactobacillus psittaci]KRL62555.1 hypothetical protein FC23_GL001322 [Lactobacillus psittaci DSM 15354]
MNKVTYPEFSELINYYQTLTGDELIMKQQKQLLKSLRLAKKGDYQHALADLRTEAEKLSENWLLRKSIKPDTTFSQNINLLRHSRINQDSINTLYEVKAAGNKAVHELAATKAVCQKCFYDYFKVLREYAKLTTKPARSFILEKVLLAILLAIFIWFLLKWGQAS